MSVPKEIAATASDTSVRLCGPLVDASDMKRLQAPCREIAVSGVAPDATPTLADAPMLSLSSLPVTCCAPVLVTRRDQRAPALLAGVDRGGG